MSDDYDAYRDNCSLVGIHHPDLRGHNCLGLHEGHEMTVAGLRLRVCSACATYYADPEHRATLATILGDMA